MSAFRYRALDANGKRVSGILEADSEKNARRILREKALTPIAVDITQGSSKNKIAGSTWTRKKRLAVNLNTLALLTRQLATLIDARLPIADALQGILEQTDKPHVKAIIAGVRSKVLEGLSLADALNLYPHAFDNTYCKTVAAGERTGKLSLVLNRLADHIEKQRAIKQKIQHALIYPSLMISISIFIVAFLLAFVVPKIMQVFANSGQVLPIPTLILLAISHFIKADGIYFLVLMMVCGYVLMHFYRRATVKLKIHQLLLRVPLLGQLIKNINTARFSRTLSILMTAAVPIIEAMQIATSLIKNMALETTIGKAAVEVQEGTSLSVALRQTQAFQPMSLHLIGSGESSGQLPEMLRRAAENQESDMTYLIDTALGLLEPFIILLMGAIVLFIVMAILLPIFDLDQMVAN